MPRTKSTVAASPAKRLKAVKKPLPKTIHPQKKAKSVLVDVIEDEPIESSWSESEVDGEINSEAFNELLSPKEKKKLSAEENDGIDVQKKFFANFLNNSETSKEKKLDGVKTRPSDDGKRSVGLYRRLVFKFIILILIVAALVFYFSFSKLTVVLNLKGEPINDNLLLKVTDSNWISTSTASGLQNDPREDVGGTIKEIETSLTKTYPATGETGQGEELIGQVRLINNYNKNQALVATTRILSPDNKLFRIKDAVNIPAGGEVTVDIYTDKPGEDMAINPTNFTIPGLWLGLQDKIYAKSDTAFKFTKKVKKYILASDLDNANKDISEELIKQAKQQASGSDLSNSWFYIANDPAVVSFDSKSGDKKDEFTATASGKIVAISFNKDEAAKLASSKLNLVVPDDKELTEFKPENISYSLDDYDAISHTASIKAAFSGLMVLKSDAQIIDPAQLVNLSDEQIGTYLKSQPEIKEYKLNFSPSFIKKAPSLVDRIKVEVNKE